MQNQLYPMAQRSGFYSSQNYNFRPQVNITMVIFNAVKSFTFNWNLQWTWYIDSTLLYLLSWWSFSSQKKTVPSYVRGQLLESLHQNCRFKSQGRLNSLRLSFHNCSSCLHNCSIPSLMRIQVGDFLVLKVIFRFVIVGLDSESVLTGSSIMYLFIHFVTGCSCFRLSCVVWFVG